MRLEKITPKGVLVIYNNNLVTFRDVVDNIALEERKLTKEEIESILSNFDRIEGKEKPVFRNGIIPENLISYKYDYKLDLVWKVPSGVKYLKFTESEHNGYYAHPKLLFRLEDTSLHVVAYTGVKRIKLYRAPFANIDDISNVCMGNVSFDYSSNYIDNIMNETEDKFFGSLFSDHMFSDYCLIGKNKDVFPTKKLKKSNLRYEEFISF